MKQLFLIQGSNKMEREKLIIVYVKKLSSPIWIFYMHSILFRWLSLMTELNFYFIKQIQYLLHLQKTTFDILNVIFGRQKLCISPW